MRLIREQHITPESLDRLERYAGAHRLDVDALIEAAITMSVPERVDGTATPEILELERRARLIDEAP